MPSIATDGENWGLEKWTHSAKVKQQESQNWDLKAVIDHLFL